MKYTRHGLISKMNNGAAFDFLFFWGHRPNKNGVITKSCLSQWWKSSFFADGVWYATAEQWMMASKASLFGDQRTLAEILRTDDPQEIKKLGRLIKPFDAVLWEENKFDIVLRGNLLKFRHDDRLKDFLLSTGEAVIVEASPVDAVWGIGLPEDSKESKDPRRWPGENLLGFALMEVRDRLRTIVPE